MARWTAVFAVLLLGCGRSEPYEPSPPPVVTTHYRDSVLADPTLSGAAMRTMLGADDLQSICAAYPKCE